MIKILKASAGSGKTYRLSETYVNMLLAAEGKRERPYRNILAVTFTNKATAQMKDKILERLVEKSATDPRAKKLLYQILHDYSAFSVSTIDKFFQQTLRAFAREIGQYAAYQIELDKDSLIREAMDSLLDSLSEEQTELLSWLKENAMEQVMNGEKVNLEGSLVKFGKSLKSEEHRRLVEVCKIDESKAYSKENLKKVRSQCRATIAQFNKKVNEYAREVAPGLKKKNSISKIEEYLKEKKTKEVYPSLFDSGNKTLADEICGSKLYELFSSSEYKEYITAHIVEKLVYSLGVAREFYARYDALLAEKNVLSLDETNVLLRQIIDGSDTPFVYEKTGVKYFNYLLDEFQDTSVIQWENFRPLLQQSISYGADSLIVGDVKQSIYRWRDGDWNLLGSKVKDTFGNDADVKNMEDNWRSNQAILDFCRDFFYDLRGKLELDKDVFDGFAPNKKSKDAQTGYVQVQFCDDQHQAVLDSIDAVRKKGARFSDILILVRGNAQGAKVADFLSNSNIPIVSNDSLSVRSSRIVRELVAKLNEKVDDRVFHSLVDYCESCLRDLAEAFPIQYKDETLFIQSFMDDLQTWAVNNGNNLKEYLDHFESSDIYISSPDRSDAVRIMTIHKAKGLEAEHVIFPYAEKVDIFKKCTKWCEKDGVLYPVDLSGSIEKSSFDEDYKLEKRQQLIDNFNLLYVALTRARKSLHVISKTPSGAANKRVSAGDYSSYTSFAEYLYGFIGMQDCYCKGEPYDFNLMKRESEPEVQELTLEYKSIALGDRLQASQEAIDFFGDDGDTGVEASARMKGTALHSILSMANTVSDLPGAVDAHVMSGMISREESRIYLDFLKRRVESHPEWFSDSVVAANEISIISDDGRFLRPDRVIEDGSRIIVVDYKFARPRDKYSDQVREYVNLYRKMGYTDVRGVLWYVYKNEVVAISDR